MTEYLFAQGRRIDKKKDTRKENETGLICDMRVESLQPNKSRSFRCDN